jgi:Transposase DDE domain group 1
MVPDSGGDLCSQPTISRSENAPTLREIIRLTYALVDIWWRSYQKPPRCVVLDIDDTVDVVHGHQQLAQWNAHYDERCFLRNLIRIWVKKLEAGAFDEDARAADLLQEYEAKIAALERMVDSRDLPGQHESHHRDNN